MAVTLERADALPVARTLVLASILGLLVVLADVVTGSELSFSIFYVAPIALIAWRFGRAAGLVTAALGAGVWYAAELIGDREYSQPLIPLWNGLVRFGFFAIIAVLLVTLHDLLREQFRESRVDALTGLLNRRGFVERAEIELARAARSKRPLTLAYFDLDDFKALNDSAGHAAGDELLRRVGASAHATIRETDLIGRMGGDEFALLLPEADSIAARTVVERLGSRLRSISDDTGVGFSFGVVTFDPPPVDVNAAVQQADRLMYVAKHEGRGTARYEIDRGGSEQPERGAVD